MRFAISIAAVVLFTLARLGHTADTPLAGQAEVSINFEGHTGPVRAIAFTPDSELLCTAGMDKVVHVWRLPPRKFAPARAKAILRQRWGDQKTLRWEIARGLRGSIYALAIHPGSGRLAMAGYGSRGGTGEIIWQDPYLARFLEARYEHSEVITGLSYSSDGKWLASAAINGEVNLWPDPGGKPIRLAGADSRAALPEFRPVVIAGTDAVIVPRYVRATAEGHAVWQLSRYRISAGRFDGELDQEHFGAVSALAAGADGQTFSSADQSGRVFVWGTNGRRPRGVLRVGQPAISLGLSPDGSRLAVGTRKILGKEITQLQVWDVNANRLVRERTLDDSVHACAISPDGQRLAYCGSNGNDVFVEWLEPPHDLVTFRGGKRIAGVALAVEGENYALRYRPDQGAAETGSSRFPLSELNRVEDEGAPREPSQFFGPWSFVADRAKGTIWLYYNRSHAGQIQLDAASQGRLVSQCWVPGQGGNPAAVAVGTDVQNGVFLYGLPEGGVCPLLRYCRGHTGMVTSVNASPDGRYVISGSADGTVRVWSLRHCFAESVVLRRWGAALRADPSGRGLIVESIDELGPLFQKGVRQGDRIELIKHVANGRVEENSIGGRMLELLGSLPWDLQVVFFPRRGDSALQPFNLRGAWHQILTFYPTGSEWIAWTPAGYYACSPGGERLMGWVVNHRDLNQAPVFYTAEQCHRALYRPEIIRQLLVRGAVAEAGEQRVESPVDVVPPVVRILDPTQRAFEQDSALVTVTASAETQDNRPVIAMRLHLDGRPYEKHVYQKSIVRASPSKARTWQVALPPGKHVLQVIAETEQSEGASEEIWVTYNAEPEKPALYIVAVGISQYHHAPLKYAHRDATEIASVFAAHARELFQSPVIQECLDQAATRDQIIGGLEWLREQMTPEDVGIFFYSGHGLQNERGDFFLCPSNGDPEDVAGTCISSEVLKEYCETTRGRLLLMIDACHSGGIDLRGAPLAAMDNLARDLSRKEYSVILMASSTGKEVSWEDDRWQAGAFAKAVAEGLLGKANAVGPFADDVISTIELDFYVYNRVLQLTERQQTPVSSKPPIPPFGLTTPVAAGGT